MLRSGEEYLFFGKITIGKYSAREMISPMFMKTTQSVDIKPIYPQSKNITSKMVQSAVKNALESIDTIPEYLPENILERYDLVSLDTAIRDIHFPKDDDALQRARDRLIFDELFILQLSLLCLKSENTEITTSNIVEKSYTD
jgi:ATP-dependent DNA helicase RecG